MKISQIFGRQSPDFKGLEQQLERKQQIKAAGSEKNPAYASINPRSHWTFLRSAIEEVKTGIEPEIPQELKHLVGREARKEFQKIVSRICSKKAGYPDPSRGELKHDIDLWLKRLTDNELEASPKNNKKIEDAARLFFGALADSVNLNELYKTVEVFANRHKFQDQTISEQKKLRKLFVQSYKAKYPLKTKELLRLFNAITGVAEPFSYFTMRKTMHKIYDDAGITSKDRWRALVGLKLFLGSICHAAGPIALTGVSSALSSLNSTLGSISGVEPATLSELDQKIQKIDDVAGMTLAPLANYTGNRLGKAALMALLEHVRKINTTTNSRIANCSLTRALEFDGDKHFTEIFDVLRRGKQAQQKLIMAMQTDIPASAIDILSSLGALGTINPTLAAISLLSMPAIYAISRKGGEKIQDTNRQEAAATAKSSNSLSERVKGQEAIRSSPTREDIIADIEKRLDEADQLDITNTKQIIGLQHTSMSVFYLTTCVSLTTGSLLYLNNPANTQHSDLLANAFFTQRMQFPFKQLLETYYTKVPKLIQDIQRMNQVLEQVEALNAADRAAEAKRMSATDALKDGHDISIQNLHWKGILKGVNLEIPNGDIIGIVGTSGTGKSSLIKTIVGINKPNKGSVSISDHNLADIKQDGEDSIYTKLAYSNQFPEIFNDINLRENLLLWSGHNPGDEKIQEVLQELGLDKFTDQLDSNDFHFSGGERARIGIARALLKNPKVLILDEPSAGLDEHTTQGLVEIIKHIKRPSTATNPNPYEDTTIICVTQDVTFREELAKLAQAQKKTGIVDIATMVTKPMSPQEYFAKKKAESNSN